VKGRILAGRALKSPKPWSMETEQWELFRVNSPRIVWRRLAEWTIREGSMRRQRRAGECVTTRKPQKYLSLALPSLRSHHPNVATSLWLLLDKLEPCHLALWMEGVVSWADRHIQALHS
jgi:hypothetical protein